MKELQFGAPTHQHYPNASVALPGVTPSHRAWSRALAALRGIAQFWRQNRRRGRVCSRGALRRQSRDDTLIPNEARSEGGEGLLSWCLKASRPPENTWHRKVLRVLFVYARDEHVSSSLTSADSKACISSSPPILWLFQGNQRVSPTKCTEYEDQKLIPAYFLTCLNAWKTGTNNGEAGVCNRVGHTTALFVG